MCRPSCNCFKLLNFFVPEIADVKGGRKKFKTPAKDDVGRQSLRKQRKQKRKVVAEKEVQVESFQQRPQNKQVARYKTFLQIFSKIVSSNLRHQFFVAVSENPGGMSQ